VDSVDRELEGGSFLQAGLDPPFNNDTTLPTPGNFSRWELGIQSLWLNFSDPTILNVTNQSWDPRLAPPNYVIVPQNVQGWIYLLITSTALPYNNLYRNYVPAAHPVRPLDLKGRAFLKARRMLTKTNRSISTAVSCSIPSKKWVVVAYMCFQLGGG